MGRGIFAGGGRREVGSFASGRGLPCVCSCCGSGMVGPEPLVKLTGMEGRDMTMVGPVLTVAPMRGRMSGGRAVWMENVGGAPAVTMRE